MKKEGWRLMASMRGIMGVSRLPLGDLSGFGSDIAAMVAAFLFSNSIGRFFLTLSLGFFISGQDLLGVLLNRVFVRPSDLIFI